MTYIYQNVTLFMRPDVPDLTRTVITMDMPVQTYHETVNEVRFKIFDMFDNSIGNNTATFLQNFVVKPIEGDLTYKEELYDEELQVVRASFGINAGDEYVVSIQANYPPRDLKFNIYYIMSSDPQTGTVIMFPIQDVPFTTIVKPILADFRTQIYG